jgi:hypothetical protein
LVENEKLTPEEAFLWVRINNVPPGFKYRRATLLNLNYPRRLIDHGIKKLVDLNLIRELKENIRNVQYESIDLSERWYKMNQTLVQNEPNVGTKRTTNKTISKNINNGENSPKKTPALTPLRGGLNIDHLIEPGTRRKRLEDSIERIIGFELMPGFFKWLEADFMRDKTKLPIRAYTKKRQDILSLATNYLSLVVMGDRLGETTEGKSCS